MKKLLSLIIIGILMSTTFGVTSASYHHIPSFTQERTSEVKKWTVLLYFCEDNSLTGALQSGEFHFFSGNNVTIIALEDTLDGPAQMWYFDEHGTMILLQNMSEVNMGASDTLKNFITYGKENYPAERYMLYLFDHGGGWLGVCSDQTDNDILTMNEIQQVLGKTGKIDIISIQACLMSQLECAYELKDNTDMYIASEEIGSVWQEALPSICSILNNQSSLTSIETGVEIVHLLNQHPWGPTFTYSAIRTSKISQLAGTFELLAKGLLKHWFTTSYRKVDDAHKKTFQLGQASADTYKFVDLYNFTENLLAEGVDASVQQRLIDVQEAFNETVIAEGHGNKQKGCHGLSVYFPDTFMQNRTTLWYSFFTLGLDFPKDTFWNEFLGIYVFTHRILG